MPAVGPLPAATHASGPGCAWVDGAFVAPDRAAVAVTDRGFLYGDSVFESLRVRGGGSGDWPAHHARLERGAGVLGIEGVPAVAELTRVVSETVARAGLPDAYVRVTVTRGRGGRGVDPAGAGPATVVVVALPPPAAPPPLGVDVVLLPPAPVPVMPPVTVKCGAYVRAVIARTEARRRGAHDALYRDERGDVTEASTSNLFVVAGAALATPPPSVCLPGITRARVLGFAASLGLTAREGPVSVDAVLAADEVFLTNAVAGAYPVRSVDGHPIGTATPGPRTRAVAAALGMVGR